MFTFLILSSFVIGALNGRLEDVTAAMLASCDKAVKVSFSLIGIMAFWLGVVKIAQKSGLINLLSKAISPILKLLFNELKKDSPAFSDIALNITANAFGLANAATPFGIKAMKELKSESKNENEASNSMCLFLGMNTAGFQLIPSTVLAILIANGAKNPGEIILPVFLVTFSSFVFAIFISKIFAKFWRFN